MFFPFISYHINYINVLYHHTKAILPYDFHYTFGNFYFYKAFVVSLVSIDIVSMFILLILIEVKPNMSDIFSRFYI